jgi:uncharacterized membrane-anchored protein
MPAQPRLRRQQPDLSGIPLRHDGSTDYVEAILLLKIPGSVAFWAAYVLARPLDATLGDTLTKPHAEGGLALGRITSSLVIAGAMMALIALTSRREHAEVRS